ncbi:hypothetical protein ALI144C_41785 [Actinosynnema sp. ALI-1.44]|nr:hypothetical protein ALI144C_41785 [Actinosynnema sp. ALI-1.44]
MAEAVEAEYTSLSALRIRMWAHREHSEFPDDVEVNVRAESDLLARHDVLDVGFGTGDFLKNLHAAGHSGRLVGVDTSESAVADLRGHPGVDARLGSATDLPLPDDAFDRVCARYMLYHVSDPSAALREFRRVSRDGGVTVVVVNHADVVPGVMGMVREEVERHVADPGVRAVNSVHSDNLPDLMGAVFRRVRVRRVDNSLVFHEPAQLLRFAGAVTSMCGMRPDAPERDAVIRSLTTRISSWFERNGGPWRDPKGYSICVGDR